MNILQAWRRVNNLSLLQNEKIEILSKEKIEVRGAVERIGPYHSQDCLSGFLVLLERDNKPYTVFMGSELNAYLIGLTTVGDEVILLAYPDRLLSSKNFVNLTLNARLAHYTGNEKWT